MSRNEQIASAFTAMNTAYDALLPLSRRGNDSDPADTRILSILERLHSDMDVLIEIMTTEPSEQ